MVKLERSAGVILHPTSLPGPGGVGVIGEAARRFVDRLVEANLRWWQVLPLNPPGYEGSPYSATSAFAGNPMLVDLAPLVERGWLTGSDDREFREEGEKFPPRRFVIDEVTAKKGRILAKAARRWRESGGEKDERFQAFCCENGGRWLDDFALFAALKAFYGGASWKAWAPELVRRDISALRSAAQELATEIAHRKFVQWQFFEQWGALREYGAKRGVRFLGDLPIFVAMDSADVWANQHFFQLNEQGEPDAVAGVPPDYFSETGQRWGNPLYDWEQLERDGYQWWIERVQQVKKTVDLVRVDHFRGFEAYWRIPAEEATAVHGEWVQGPKDALFDAIRGALGTVPFVAEDLGIITEGVEALRDRQGLPGMKVMQFAFDAGDDHPYLPHTYPEDCVAYTGTHDNNTTAGWFAELEQEERHRVRSYLSSADEEVVAKMIESLWRSKAACTIIPVQDLFGLGSQARMNTPGVAQGNWSWRMSRKELEDEAAFQWLGRLTRDCGRQR